MYVLSIVLRHSSLRMYDKALETSVVILFFTNNFILNHNELCMIYNALQDTWYYHSCSFHSTLSSVENNSWNMCKYLNLYIRDCSILILGRDLTDWPKGRILTCETPPPHVTFVTNFFLEDVRWCSQVYWKILATVKILDTCAMFLLQREQVEIKIVKERQNSGLRLSIKFHLTWAGLYWEKAKATVEISWTLLPWSWQSGALPWSPAWSCRSCPTGQCWSHSQVVSWPPPPCCLVQSRVLGVKDVDVFPTLTGFIITLQWPFLKDEQFFNFTSCVSFIYPSPAC